MCTQCKNLALASPPPPTPKLGHTGMEQSKRFRKQMELGGQ